MAVPALDSTALASVARGRVGKRVGEWTLRKLVTVQVIDSLYWATAEDQRRCSIRLLHPALALDGDLQKAYGVASRIAAEVGHPDAPIVTDEVSADDGSSGLIFALERAEPIAALAGRPIPAGKALRLVRDVLGILETAHSRGICHGALGPNEVFVTDDGHVKLMGFGVVAVAAQLPELLAQEPWSKWLSPEIRRGGIEALEPASDLWVLGLLAATLLLGASPPFAGGAPPSFAEHAPDAPARLVRLLDRALESEPDARFQDASLMRAMIEEAMELHGGYAVARSFRGNLADEQPPPDSGSPMAPVRVEIGPTGGPPIQVNAPTIPSIRIPDLSAYAVTERPRHTPPPASPPVSPPRGPVRGARDTMPAAAPIPESERRIADVGDSTGYAFVTADRAEVDRLQALFRTMELAILARGQYGSSHPEWFRRFERLCTEFLEAVEATERGLFWNVTPYAFKAGEQAVWEPDGVLGTIPYELFADGVRTLGVTRGLELAELESFLRIITVDVNEIHSEDDLVTLLWEAGFSHVVYHAVDLFVEGDWAMAERVRDEQRRIRILAHFDTTFQLEECWQDARGQRPPSAPFTPPLINALARIPSNVALSGVGAGDSVAATPRPDSESMRALSLDPAQRTTVGARIRAEQTAPSRRFASVVARAFARAEVTGQGRAMGGALSAALLSMSVADPARAVEVITLSLAAFGKGEDADKWRSLLADRLLASDLIASLVSVVDLRGDDALVDALVALLDTISQRVQNLRDLVGEARHPTLQRFLLSRLSSSVVGREDEIAALLETADLPTALSLVRSLQEANTLEARRALEVAAEHPDPFVRLEALRGASSDVLEKHRKALRALVESDDPDVRRSTLATVREHSIRAAGPLIAMRAKSGGFDALPTSEKADVLETLAVLLPSRAEALCVELVQVPGLVSSPGNDDTRVVAAQILAKIASSSDVADVLEAESKRFLRNSVRVRQAVADAARTVRSSIPPPARKGRT